MTINAASTHLRPLDSEQKVRAWKLQGMEGPPRAHVLGGGAWVMSRCFVTLCGNKYVSTHTSRMIYPLHLVPRAGSVGATTGPVCWFFSRCSLSLSLLSWFLSLSLLVSQAMAFPLLPSVQTLKSSVGLHLTYPRSFPWDLHSQESKNASPSTSKT